MKKYWKLLLAVAVGMVGLAACEDVPAPYNIPSDPVGPVGPTGDFIFSQTFTSSLGDFQSQSESGTLEWTADSRYGAIITGYQDFDGSGQKTNKPGTTFLISPEIELNDCDSAYVVIEQAINYAKTTLDADHKLLIRVAGTEAWTELPMSMDGLGNSFSYITQNVQIPQNYIGQKIQLALKHIAHNDYSSTWEVKSVNVAKGQAPAPGGTPIEGLIGSGTKDDPYDVPSTIKLIAAGPPTTKIYTKGIISKIDEIDTGSFGNATYYISNDGTTTDQLEVYRGYGLGGARFKSTDDIKVGDEVIVYGQVVYYNNKTMEFTQGSELYSLNGEIAEGGGGGGGGGTPAGSGSKEDPYNVAAAVAGSGNAWVKGYIVGWVEGQKLDSGAKFNANASVTSNILIADSPDETNVANCMPVQLPVGAVRDALNLQNNPSNFKKQVSLYGSLEKYFGTAGLKSVSEYMIDGSTPTPTPTPGEAKGTGTLEDPLNSVAANNIASALGSGAESAQAYYIKGKVVSIAKDKNGNPQNFDFENYGNASFYISDDGTNEGQFYIYRVFYLGNKKWESGAGDILKVGDEVVVYAKLTNYKGNTPETVAAKEGQNHGYLYSLNGKTDGGDTPEPGPTPSDVKTLADFTNGDFEAWTGGQPDGWKSASSASNATLSQSTDAHGGSYSVKVGGASQNKRIAYEELVLEAGTYNCSFWAKAATESPASLCPGYAEIGEDGNIAYKYDQGEDGKNKYVNDIVQEWQQVTYSFTLGEKKTVCLIIMNSKSTGTDLLIDDFTITKK